MGREKKQTTPEKWGHKYLITVNKPTLTSLLTSVTIADFPECNAYKYALEVGEKGNLHKHLYLSLSRSLRFSTVLNRVKKHGADVKVITPGTEQTVIQYIGSSDKEETKGCTVISEYTTSWGDLNTSQGQRNDLSTTDVTLFQIKDAIDAGATIREIYNDFFPYMMRYGKGIIDYIQFCRHENMPAEVHYMVNKTAEQHEYELEQKWAEDKTQILLDMDVLSPRN